MRNKLDHWEENKPESPAKIFKWSLRNKASMSGENWNFEIAHFVSVNICKFVYGSQILHNFLVQPDFLFHFLVIMRHFCLQIWYMIIFGHKFWFIFIQLHNLKDKVDISHQKWKLVKVDISNKKVAVNLNLTIGSKKTWN